MAPSPDPESGAPRQHTVDLVRDFLDGDQDAFRRLYELHREPVLRSIAVRLGCPLRQLVCPDDILQEAFIDAWRWLREQSAERFQTPGTFRNVVVGIARNRLADAARAASTEKRDHARTARLDDAEPVTGAAARPSQAARAEEIAAVQHRALLLLPEKYRTIIDCRDTLGLRYDEIAAALGIRRENAKLRYSRAIHKWNEVVRGMLPEYREEEP